MQPPEKSEDFSRKRGLKAVLSIGPPLDLHHAALRKLATSCPGTNAAFEGACVLEDRLLRERLPCLNRRAGR